MDELTVRESQVLTLIASGSTTKEIACELQISVKTADCHRSRLMQKLNIHKNTDLTRFAIRTGLVTA